MAPIRVGLVGLAAIDASQAGLHTWGVLAHLKPILLSPYYELVAVCNSSVESARKAIAFHQLPASVAAYGSPDDIASDPNVDLIVVSVHVSKHFLLTKPALLRNKQVFVEWPLGASLEEAEELAVVAREHQLKTVVGLQFVADPLIVKVKELIANGVIGRVTSSVAVGCSSAMPADVWFEGHEYYISMKGGANEYYIYFGHFLGGFTHALGDFETFQTTLKTQYPSVAIINSATGAVVKPDHPKTTPDHILIQGTLQSGAVTSISFRKAKETVDGLALRWLITGTKGEIEVQIPEGQIQMAPEGRTIRLRTEEASEDDSQKIPKFRGILLPGQESEPETVAFESPSEPEYITKVPVAGRNTARMYEAYRQGDTTRYVDFESALQHHKLLHQMAKDGKYL